MQQFFVRNLIRAFFLISHSKATTREVLPRLALRLVNGDPDHAREALRGVVENPDLVHEADHQDRSENIEQGQDPEACHQRKARKREGLGQDRVHLRRKRAKNERSETEVCVDLFIL